MAVRDWPLPLRRFVGYAVLLGAAAILVGTTGLLGFALVSIATTGHTTAPWTSSLVLYSTIVTAVVSAICGFGVFETVQRKGAQLPQLHFVMAVVVGILVGLFMVPLTGGYSLVCGPPAATLATLVAWLFRRKRREGSSEKTAGNEHA